MTPDRNEISAYFQQLQDYISNALEKADGQGKFREDLWDRPEGGGGRSRVIIGEQIEKGGVNYSAVHGPMPETIAKSLGLGAVDFYATGVSIVLHPRNPWVPIIHMNVRYFETSDGTWWFGGGIDLTPHYILHEDAQFFHRKLKFVCDQHGLDYYSKFKEWADNYFYIPHRNETRGIGGIFFDRLDGKNGFSKQDRFDFVRDVGESFVPIYTSILAKRMDYPFNEGERDWQLLRRGRYVEFNLVWDRGTKFGLQTNGRIESILMSMPPLAQWEYANEPEEDSKEKRTLDLLRKGVDWVDDLGRS